MKDWAQYCATWVVLIAVRSLPWTDTSPHYLALDRCLFSSLFAGDIPQQFWENKLFQPMHSQAHALIPGLLLLYSFNNSSLCYKHISMWNFFWIFLNTPFDIKWIWTIYFSPELFKSKSMNVVIYFKLNSWLSQNNDSSKCNRLDNN